MCLERLIFNLISWIVNYTVIAVHPEWNLVFFVGKERTIITYDMDYRKVHVIPTLVV
jgi:hypothetical protein